MSRRWFLEAVDVVVSEREWSAAGVERAAGAGAGARGAGGGCEAQRGGGRERRTRAGAAQRLHLPLHQRPALRRVTSLASHCRPSKANALPPLALFSKLETHVCFKKMCSYYYCHKVHFAYSTRLHILSAVSTDKMYETLHVIIYSTILFYSMSYHLKMCTFTQ